MSKYKIPYRAAPIAIPITEKTKKDVLRVLENPRQTNEIELFEREFAKFCNSKYTITVNGCTSAMHLGLLACGVGLGDEVITQPNSFVTTGDCITYVGAKPVFADIDEKTLTIDPESIKEKITSKTKGILPVHMYGHSCDMDPIMEIAEDYDLSIVEDAAHSVGAKYQGKMLGSLGDNNITCFSFGGKVMTALGPGGAAVTNNEEYYENMLMRRYAGQLPIKEDVDSVTYDNLHFTEHVIGYNLRMDEMRCTILRNQLTGVNDANLKRRDSAKEYNELLNEFDFVTTPVEKDWAYHVYLHYVARFPRRDDLQKYLDKNGIQSHVLYKIPLHLQEKTFKSMFNYKKGDFPITEKAKAEILGLPQDPNMTSEARKEVVNKIKMFYQS
jgi:dTDP-4-amino-4,6-dideoxygalactose transaminase